MHILSRTILLLLSFLLLFATAFRTQAQTSQSLFSHEKFVIRTVRTIQSAQITYSSVYGNGNFATLSQLYQVGLMALPIDASGEKYGYRFDLLLTPLSTGVPASFRLTATPILYPKTGRRSFYIDNSGGLHAADRNGLPATATDPTLDYCAIFGEADNERCTIRDLRWFHNAENTYAATFGNGNYGSIGQLAKNLLISSELADGTDHGYSFSILTTPQTQQNLPTHKIYATPITYGLTGVRSFFINETGIIRGADKNGLPANENDPPINTDF